MEKKSIENLSDAVSLLDQGFDHLPPFDASASIDYDRLTAVLSDASRRMRDNYPYHHPLYAGQMLKPPHAIARTAYAMAQWINPNNHALDGGKASSEMEKEAVAGIAAMFGWDEHLGHLTSGGTFANLEALWIAGQLRPGERILASNQAHYTHSRISAVLKLPFQAVACDERGKMDMAALEALLKAGNVGTVVITLGTTGVGSVDPLPEILQLREIYGFRIHVDAAYGGYFRLVDCIGEDARAAFDLIGQADSIVIAPHKHGLQPYGCGCILFKDPEVGRHYLHSSPYTYFTSDELHLGEISLECSRAGASAVALWSTMQYMPLDSGGEFAGGLAKGRMAAMALYEKIVESPDTLPLMEPELDIVTWAMAGVTASEISKKSQSVFDQAEENGLHLALINLPKAMVAPWWPGVEWNQDTVTCLRSVLMKPEHLEWIDRIWDILESSRA